MYNSIFRVLIIYLDEPLYALAIMVLGLMQDLSKDIFFNMCLNSTFTTIKIQLIFDEV